jgi:hypothetical protein
LESLNHVLVDIIPLPIFVVPKKGGTFPSVLDYPNLNDNSLDDRYTMKDVRECIGEIGRAGSTILSTMDLTSGSGFWQLPLEQNSQGCIIHMPRKGVITMFSAWFLSTFDGIGHGEPA